MDVAAYLSRIGCPPPAAPSAAALQAIHEAHCSAIPFENLDILLGRRIGLDLGSLQAKLVAARRGGYCFEQNTLLQAALEALGFRVAPLAARVLVGATAVRARTHMLLQVEAEGRSFLADAGFGGDGPVRPLPFEDGALVETGLDAHRLARRDDLWVLQSRGGTGGWVDLYAFTLERQYAVDFEMANHFTSTHPRSAFVLNLTVQRSWPERRLVLRNRELTIREPGSTRPTFVRNPDHLLELLASPFGLDFPAGTRFSYPTF